MKLTALISALLISSFLLPNAATAQGIGSWELGISGQTGKNFYNRKYFNQPALPPGRTTHLKSNYLFGAGVWVEKYVNQHISAIGQLRYTVVDVPTNFLCECGNTGWVILQDEKHYWGSLEVGLRYYLNPKAALVLYTEGKAAGDWFIAAKEKRNDNVYTHWDVMGYSHLVPGLSFAIGAKWKRLGVSLGGNTNVVRTIVREIGVHDKVSYGMRTGILSRGLFARASFTLFKLK